MSDEQKPKSNSILKSILSWNAVEILLRTTPLVFILIVIVVLGIRIGFIQGNNNILRDLSDPAVARGLITLLFAMATVWIAMILTFAAVSDKTDDDKFSRGKDILTILVGIFGTIIGYYFGAESQQVQNQRSPADEVQIVPEERQLPSDTDQ